MKTVEKQIERTSLYLTEENKNWLNRQPRGQRTKLINEAIAKLHQEKEQEERKQKLLKMLDNLPTFKTNGKSIYETLQEGRNRD